ncbi:hypothetical protein Xvie_02916 [Xenorhabdus vietnamensis]|uniref:Secreted protein n=1 Tax=Xenorhabdus vietnamensis TaxID=351656 RepID=A0A1Y2S993_9GAMM|nr:hypothetical protein [Xenorhabdus vietnamensis]OTA15250.1 hypothetical protein Xvie_02916 [Xenorhabdus vietnamensis]
MRYFSYVLLLGAFYIPASFADTSVTGVKRNQESAQQGALIKCTDLLPADRKYTISIIGKLDKTTKDANQRLKGNLNVSDETNKPLNQEMGEAVKPFVQCVTDTVL